MTDKPRTTKDRVEQAYGEVTYCGCNIDAHRLGFHAGFAAGERELEPVLDLLEDALGFLGWNEAEQELKLRIEVFLENTAG